MGVVEVLDPVAPTRAGGWKVDVSRGERNGRVSSEWFNRPDDERYLSLDDLWASVKGRCERSRADLRMGSPPVPFCRDPEPRFKVVTEPEPSGASAWERTQAPSDSRRPRQWHWFKECYRQVSNTAGIELANVAPRWRRDGARRECFRTACFVRRAPCRSPRPCRGFYRAHLQRQWRRRREKASCARAAVRSRC